MILHRTSSVVERPLFRADWVEVLFLHFEVDPRVLQPAVPFHLDVRDDRAYVSLVAFMQRNLRPVFGGRIARLLAAPLAEHAFLNVRTYVRHAGERGIFFIAEWIPNRLASLIGPRTYGLPYRLGKLTFHHGAEDITGDVRASPRRLYFSAKRESNFELTAAEPESLTEFLLERYVAFTCRRGVRRRFAVRHAPWPQCTAHPQITRADLLELAGAWHRHARLCGAHYSPGVRDVVICSPTRVQQLSPAE